MGRRAVLALGAVVAALSACMPFYAQPEAQVIDPPARFERLYAEMERCLGRRGDFDEVTWWLVPGYVFHRDGWMYEALWSPGHNITLTAWNSFLNDALIRHEIAHDLGFSAEQHQDPRVLRCTGTIQPIRRAARR